jgi:LuxR family transcriptional regulator, maltose regulon positive regulatory protein
MTKDVPILLSKLMVPRTSDTIIRDKLRPLTLIIPEKKVTVVTAGAGYGKTTLVSQAVLGHETVWYRLDSLDRDFATFMSHLVAGTRRIFPEFGAETTKRLEDGEALGLEYKGVVALFIHELGSAQGKDIMIVLDDYHNVQDNPLIRDTVQLMVENLCPSVHLIIVSRSDVPLKLSRLRAMREVLDISQEDLLFTTDEIRQFFQQLFRVSLTEDSLEVLQAKTAGWVSALILFFHSIRQKDAMDIEQEVYRLRGSGRLISEYLAENVFASLQTELKNFLLRTSILSRLNAPFCNRLLNISNAAKILRRLQESHLFTFALDEEGQEYCYHQLFQEYLQAALDTEMGGDGKGRLHLEAARILEENGDNEEALRHYFTAGAFEQACTVLEKISMVLIGSGRHELMNAFLEKIPEPFFRSHPWLEYQRGFTYIFSGSFNEAGSSFLKALVLFKEKQDQQGIDNCLNVMATGLYLRGDFHAAWKIFEELLKSPSLSLSLRVETLIHLVFITSQNGNMEESDRYYENALLFMPGIEEPVLREVYHACLILYYGFRHVFSGDILKAIDLAEVAKEKLQKCGNYRFLTTGYQLSSLAYAYLGHSAQGLDEACKGLALSKEKGFRDFSFGWLLCNAGLNAAGLGKIEDAVLYTKDGLKHFEKLGSYFGEGCAYLNLGIIYIYSGRFDLAEEMAQACLNAVKGLNVPHITSPAKGILAVVLIQKGKTEEGERLIREAHAEFSYSTHFNCMVFRLYAHLYWQKGLVEDALASLHKCLRIAEANRFEESVARDWEWLMPLLVILYSRGVMQGCIQKIFSVAGDNARLGLMSLQKNAEPQSAQAAADILKALPGPCRPGLLVHCLGRFQVFKGQEEIPAGSWKSSKSRMLFKLLVHYRKKGFVSKEVFMEHLWPEDDPAKTSTRFHVALTTLRRVLEPGLKRGLPSAYLKSDGDTYLLDLGKDGSVDVESFEEACSKVKTAQDDARAIDCLLEAERLYAGDFLSEDPYEPWCTKERDRIREMYLTVLAGIIDFFFSKERYAKAIDYCSRYLAADAYAEDVYQHLMRLHALTGNNTMVLKTYERCKDLIIADLGCPLSRKTEALAKELLNG